MDVFEDATYTLLKHIMTIETSLEAMNEGELSLIKENLSLF
jgi:hypothetical protein